VDINISPLIFRIFSLILGLCLGSFYNVCIHRYLWGESIVSPPSHCPKCGHRLSWWENIPVVSFIILRGKCHACGEDISPLYPIVEIISGIWSLSIAWKFGLSVPYLIYLIFGGLFIIMSFIDFISYILPDIITIPGAILAFAVSHFLDISFIESALGAIMGAGIFFIIQKLYKGLRGIEGMGGGDIKLMILIGALLGVYAIPFVVFFGALTGLLASIIYLIKDSSEGMSTKIPFGPFLCMGAMTFILFKDAILKLYT